jgi:hypothetical protein
MHLLLVTLFMYPKSVDNCSNENVYYTLLYSLEGLQTICVALLHFYTDQPVVNALKTYRLRACGCCKSQQNNFILDRNSSTTTTTNRDTWTTILEDYYFVGLELPPELPTDLPTPTVKFFVDSLDRGQGYNISLTSLDEDIKVASEKEKDKEEAVGTPDVIRNNSGFWYYKNRDVYLREIENEKN